MNKYIDADKLIKFKEALADIIVSSQGICTYQDCKDIAERESLLLIATLQQEQQEVNLDSEIEEYWIATGWSKVITLGKFKVIARYFYGLGQLNSK